MASFVDCDRRGLYSINDLTREEILATISVIECAPLPDKRLLERVKVQLKRYCKMKTIWHTKNDLPVYDPKRADNRIICTSILLGWHLNAFVAYVEEDGKVYTYNSTMHKKKQVEWNTTVIQRWAYIVDVLPIIEMADEREVEWEAKSKKIEQRLHSSDNLPF